MAVARFVAKDPYKPTATEQELDELLADMGGVVDWTIDPNGEVTVEYDRDLIESYDEIEQALIGLGFQLKHIFNKPQADEAEARRTLSE